MLKQLFDISEKKGDQNNLITLSKNYGNTQATNSSSGGIDNSIQNFIKPFGEKTSDLFINEYLDNISSKTTPPTTFDMQLLLEHLPENKINFENFWSNSLNISKSISLANDWIFQFNQGNNLNEKWTDEFDLKQKNSEGELQKSNECSVWAKDFLKNYDLTKENKCIDHYMDSNWEDEFLNNFINCRNEEENNIFFDYETAWDNYNSKEEQEKYEFIKGNPFLNEDNCIEKAQENISCGRLADSILYYEAEIQKNDKNFEIWYSLGIALAENEQDPKAISALRNSIKLSPRNGKAILALSVSLANESFECLALHELNKFICIYQNCSEDEIPKDNNLNTSFAFQYQKLDKNEFLKVESAFLDVIKFVNPGLELAELQNALSILYNLSKDYNKAIECLHIALTFKPEDPILWNRLGATLANADRSAEAINAYKRALQIFPSCVRVRYNLGISCMNLQSYKEAANHFLAALQIQHSPEQSLIWSKLRSALIRIDDIQLDNNIFEAINQRNLNKITQIFG
ncbi:hypothetical protein Mgra_00002252 [Meloidogyne graminicola]|uniref:Peroxin-5 n=1 Tax=Meloidogyne graminicola TaxID=189291 RepID=A0A8S9ZYD4_9BILA|nr:hypothetical protein Mgra_00002252 [Meloidogyne graminicola]